MRKSYKPWRPAESFLFPPSPRDWLPDGHLAYFILDLFEQFDLSAIHEVLQDRDTRGEQPFSPRLMVALLLYWYCTGVGNLAPDATYLPPMLESTMQALGGVPRSFTADAGYWSAQNAELLEETGVEPYIATSRELHGLMAPATRAGPPPADLSAKERMEWRLATEEGRERRPKRRTANEPIFGQIKEARRFRRFSLRGLPKVRGEWDLIAVAHNVLKLYRATPR